MVRLISILTFSLYTILLSAQIEVPIDSVSSNVGKNVKVCDKVVGTFVTKGDKPVTYLNLATNYPNSKLTIVIFQQDLINFPLVPSDHYKGQKVCVTGEIGTYKEKVQIIAKKPEQVEVI